MMPEADQIKPWLARLAQAAEAIDRVVTFMEVCGTHTTCAFRCGLHSLLPDNVRLVSGPGCPVCVTAQGDIDLMLELAADHAVTVCTYGDMLRVPGRRGSLETARSRGADVRVVYSSMDAIKLAQAEPQRQVVFAAVGFETTAPATAAAVLAADDKHLTNFAVLCSHKTILPAMLALLADGGVNLDGFMCPGHVSVIIGAEAYRPVVETYGRSCVVAGFEPVHMAAALARLSELVRDGDAALVNQYPEAVTAAGNTVAQELLAKVFEPADVPWRGLGMIPGSGLVLRPEYRHFDAQARFGLTRPTDYDPPGCICDRVITATAEPSDCGLFGSECTPTHPIGPCMVSSEGTCQAWFKYRRHGAAGRAEVTG